MKWILSFALMICSFKTTYATENFLKMECFSIKNKIDRKYCQDKKFEAIKKQFSLELAWYKKHGVTEKAKTARIVALEAELERNAEQKAGIDSESAALNELMTTLKAAKIDKKAKDYKPEVVKVEPEKKEVKKEEKKPETKKTAAKKEKKEEKKEEKKDTGIAGQLQNALNSLQKKK